MSSKTLLDKVKQIQQEKNEKIIPENFSENLEIFGVHGNISETDGYSQNNSEIFTDDNNEQFSLKINIIGKTILDDGADMQLDTQYSDVAEAIGLTPEKIKKDETILGITGTYEGSSTSNRYLLYSEDREDYDEETGDLLSHYLVYWIGCNNVQITSEYNADISPDGSTDVVNCINSTSDVALLGACNVDSEQQCWYISSILGVNNTDNYYTVYTCDEDGEHKQPTYAIIPPHSIYVPGLIYYISTGQQVPLSKLPALYIEVLDV